MATQFKIKLRSKPAKLDEADILILLKKNDFYCKILNSDGNGCYHDYLLLSNDRYKIVLDRVTGLMWALHFPKEAEYLVRVNAEKYIISLNKDKLFGFSDWRIPTIEEAASLIERKENSHTLHFAEIIGRNPWWTWTSDFVPDKQLAWAVSYSFGEIAPQRNNDKNSVFPVRTYKNEKIS